MKEVAEDEDSSDISGYHSDSDSAIMMSGNSPYVTKRARHNFLTRSVRSSSNRSGRTCLVLSTTGSSKSSDSPPNTDRGGGEWEWKPGGGVTCCHSCKSRAAMQVLPPHDEREIASLQVELETTRAELERTKARLELVSSKTPQQELSGPRLVRCYANLYSQARVDALDALDTLPQLHDAAELKSKILFSVVVLAFRSVTSLLNTKREQVQRILLNPAPISSAHSDLEAAISTFLHRTVDTFDLTHSIDEVSSQLWATLYDYPCLKSCSGLLQYIRDSVRLAWALTNQSPPYVLEYEQRVFRRELHVRFHSANQDSDHIRTYLWPALLQGPAGPCVHKAVVIT